VGEQAEVGRQVHLHPNWIPHRWYLGLGDQDLPLATAGSIGKEVGWLQHNQESLVVRIAMGYWE
jgi:hypothetical protein